ncbi:MAG: ferrous iron transport protein A [Clostridiales bacterium]|nr:ferrous iron transport protein A [Clostridiales bacterium]
MNLYESKLNTECVIVDLSCEDRLKLRLMELGIFKGERITVKHKSIFKKTLLVVFSSNCFTLKDEIAKQIKVNYV